MLTSFGCEQIVQVRATEFDSKSAPRQGFTLKTYSGTGSRAQPRKGPSIRGDNARGAGRCSDVKIISCFVQSQHVA